MDELELKGEAILKKEKMLQQSAEEMETNNSEEE